MYNIKIVALFLIVLFTIYSCEKIAIGEQRAINPISLFESFWEDIDQHHALIDGKNIDWIGVRDQYAPQITDATSDEDLWRIFSEMIEVLDDEHTYIEDLNFEDKAYVSGSHRIEAAIAAYSRDLITNEYLKERTIIHEDRASNFSYGSLKNRDIGYLHIGDCDGADTENVIDEVIQALDKHKAIIFDVRNNGGGNTGFVNTVTNAFAEADRDILIEQYRNGPAYDDFGPENIISNTNDNNNQFTKPVIVLTDRFTISGAERIAFHLKQNSEITHMGDTTAGAFSGTSNTRFLENGWSFGYPYNRTLDMAGNLMDGEGLIPDVTVLSTKEDIDAGVDQILEAAFDYLWLNYMIQ